jgi:lipid-A-disaccharide synthase
MQLENEKSHAKPKTIMIVAGEASGDMHGASLVREMLNINPSLHFYGVGGNKLQKAGVKLFAHVSEMAVVGLTEVISKLGKFFQIMKKLEKSLDEVKPDLVILIDFAGFNLQLAKKVHKKGIKVFYYISPQVWASRAGRIRKIKKYVDKMAVILPFEIDTYKRENYHVDYVGHPLLDLVKTEYSKGAARIKFNMEESKTTIALLPGSRLSEVSKLLPEMLKAGEIISQNFGNVQFLLPLADTLDEKIVAGVIANYSLKVNIISGHTYEAISSADLAIVASGTATLETALLGVPMVIIYKISALTYFIGKFLVRVNNIGLANIIAGKTIVEELIQDEASGKKIAAAALAILTDKERKQQIINELGAIRAKLGSPGAAIRAAKLAYDMI